MFRLRQILNAEHRLILNTVFFVTLTSVLFVHPFDNHFRFTFGVVVLSTLLLYFSKLPIVTTSVLSGLAIMVTRIVIYKLSGASGYDSLTAMLMSLPALCYYLFFGLGFYFLKVRGSIRNIPLTILKISFTDFLSNILEIAIRHTFSISESVGFLPHLVGVAFLRASLAAYGCHILKRHRAFIIAEEHLKRYAQLILVFAEIKTEMYYLQKSSQDIEKVMERSFLLYQQLDSCQPEAMTREVAAGEALKIARDIHEVKKDYYRVMTGMEDMLTPASQENGMGLSEIFYMIEQNTLRFLNHHSKRIEISYRFADDVKTNQHYAVISVLNNLIINAVEACASQGIIKVSQSRTGSDMVFRVEDNGCGIESGDLDAIFSPGYSTKHSETGKVSTGLGLAHVKNLTEMMGGSITVASRPGQGSRFTVTLPVSSLCADR